MNDNQVYILLSESAASVMTDTVYIHPKNGGVVRLTAQDFDKINQTQWALESQARMARKAFG